MAFLGLKQFFSINPIKHYSLDLAFSNFISREYNQYNRFSCLFRHSSPLLLFWNIYFNQPKAVRILTDHHIWLSARWLRPVKCSFWIDMLEWNFRGKCWQLLSNITESDWIQCIQDNDSQYIKYTSLILQNTIWYSAESKQLIEEKKKAHREWKMLHDPKDLKLFNSLRTSSLRKSKICHTEQIQKLKTRFGLDINRFG